ncbi:MAG: SGNH/GDSL hydrolase family protein [Candidatus Aminicenantia bacterium]
MFSYLKKKYLLLFLAGLLFSFCKPGKPLIVVLCVGDSITDSSYPDYLEDILISQGIKVRVWNYGRNGNTSGEYLKFLRLNKDWLKEKHPNFILLQLGTNDVRIDTDFTPADKFYQNMKEIIKIFREFEDPNRKKSKILIATILPVPNNVGFPFSEKSRERVRNEINPLIKKIAEEENLPLVDNYSIFIKNPEYLPGIHPSEEGYRTLAESWYQKLEEMI